MGKHEWESIGGDCGRTFCVNCGIVTSLKTPELSCPPWSSASEGDTKTNRAEEALLVNELKSILALIEVAQEHRYSVYSYDRLRTAETSLQKLIQKHEAKEAEGRECQEK